MKFFILYLMIIISFLSACGKKPTSPQHTTKTYEVQLSTLHKTLNFTGNIQPLSESTLTTSVDATVDAMHFHYGQFIKKNDVVFTLNSAELQRQYNDTLTEYLKCKDNFHITEAKFNGTEELWKAGLISKNNYLSEKSNLNTTRITLMQASRKLSEMLEKIGEGKYDDLSNLSFTEFANVRRALNRKHNLIQIRAPHDGVLLYPPKTAEGSTKITIGSSVKAGQVLALIGNLKGISVEIEIPEVDISEIKVGMPAIIRGIAFGRHELQGTLVAINAQASTSVGGALPSFSATVEVHDLNQEQQSWIKVGMSASIELASDNFQKLLVPIEAVKQNAGQSLVNVLTKKGQIKQQPVITGMVDGNQVAIDEGLKIGNVVVY